MGKARAEKSPQEIDWIYGLLARHRSIAFAQDAARALATAAEREMERAFRDAPGDQHTSFIRSLVRYAVEREL
jgi:hypothetical protein